MEGLDRNGTDAKLTKSSAQFAGGAIGVGQGEHAVGREVALGDSIGDSMSYGASFTGAGTGQDAGWADQ